MTSDLLQEINSTHFPDVLNTLRSGFPDAIHTYYFLLNFMVWRNLTDAVDSHFYCPNGDPNNGTVFAIAKFKNGPSYITFHTIALKPEYIIVYLRETKVFDWTKDIIFETIHEKLYPLLIVFIMEKRLKLIKDDIVRQVWIEKKKAKKLSAKIPEPLYIAPMKQSEFKYIKQYWEFYETKLDVVVNVTLNNNFAIGLYHKANDSIIGWAVEQHYGGIGMLYVLEEYRNHGYGAILVQAMSHRLVHDKNIDPNALIHFTNRKSLSLFTKLGFKEVNLAHWIFTTKL